MKISLNWIKDFTEIPKTLKPEDLGNLLTLKTAEVEDVYNQADSFDNIVAGLIIEVIPHPNADKLRITKTSVGKQTLKIICGGSNIKEGMYVAVAKVGAKVRWHGEGDPVTLEKAKIRGEESEGMICSGSEIGIETPLGKIKKEEDGEILDLSAIKPEPGTPLAEVFKKEDYIFEFDNKSLTHRPDLWGHYGIAREIAAITGGKFKKLEPKVEIPKKGDSPKVEIEDFLLCPRYCGLTIENIKVEESPDWLKQRLSSTGHGTHNNIVDVTNYVMTELGQPMHAFDKTHIKDAIIVRTAKSGEEVTALDEKTYKTSRETLLIADKEKPLAIAGVIGAKNSGINNETTSIILESANFNPQSVRRTSTKLGIRTDSVQRFEKALDPNLAELAIKRAAELILEICPTAKISGPITDVSKFDKTPKKITLNTEAAAKKIGIKLSTKEMAEMLEKLEFSTKQKGKAALEVTIPSFRATKDVRTEDDLIEEIARLYGYENIPTTLPSLPTKLPQDNPERHKKHRLREILSFGLGFSEIYNYSFYGAREIENCLLQEEGHLQLLNHLSEDQTHMRTSLVPHLLKNLENIVRYEDDANIYEIGRTYKDIGQYYPLEEKRITGAIITKGKSDNPFYKAKGVVETVFKKLSLPEISIAKEVKDAPYAHPAKAIGHLDQNGQTLAKIFMLHPVAAKNHDLEKYSIAFFDINFTEIMKLQTTEKRYKPIPKFPDIKLDVSVVIDEKTEISTLEKAIFSSAKELIQSAELFDIYQGPNLEKGKKATAFKITLRSKERTLTDKEMTSVQNSIFKNLEKLGGEIRGKAEKSCFPKKTPVF